MSPAVWIAAYYLTFFGALGIFLPYFSLWMVAHGLSATVAARHVMFAGARDEIRGRAAQMALYLMYRRLLATTPAVL